MSTHGCDERPRGDPAGNERGQRALGRLPEPESTSVHRESGLNPSLVQELTVEGVLRAVPKRSVEGSQGLVVNHVPVAPENVADLGDVEAAAVEHELALGLLQAPDPDPLGDDLIARAPEMMVDLFAVSDHGPQDFDAVLAVGDPARLGDVALLPTTQLVPAVWVAQKSRDAFAVGPSVPAAPDASDRLVDAPQPPLRDLDADKSLPVVDESFIHGADATTRLPL